MNKKLTRTRRAKRTRSHIKILNAHRLCVYRSLNHIYAQLVSPCGSKILAAASTQEADIKNQAKQGGNKKAASLVGKLMGERLLKAGIKKIAFDRSGYKYHGRVKAL